MVGGELAVDPHTITQSHLAQGCSESATPGKNLQAKMAGETHVWHRRLWIGFMACAGPYTASACRGLRL